MEKQRREYSARPSQRFRRGKSRFRPPDRRTMEELRWAVAKIKAALRQHNLFERRSPFGSCVRATLPNPACVPAWRRANPFHALEHNPRPTRRRVAARTASSRHLDMQHATSRPSASARLAAITLAQGCGVRVPVGRFGWRAGARLRRMPVIATRGICRRSEAFAAR